MTYKLIRYVKKISKYIVKPIKIETVEMLKTLEILNIIQCYVGNINM